MAKYLDSTGLSYLWSKLKVMPPAAHKNSHKTGGKDALTPADIGAATSNHNHNGVYAPNNHNHNGVYAPMYTVSQTDIVAGTTSLADGALYIVYE